MIVPGKEPDMYCPEYFNRPVAKYSPIRQFFSAHIILVIVGIVIGIVAVASVWSHDEGTKSDWWTESK